MLDLSLIIYKLAILYYLKWIHLIWRFIPLPYFGQINCWCAMWVWIRKICVKAEFEPFVLVLILFQNYSKAAWWRNSVLINTCWWKKCRANPILEALLILTRLCDIHIVILTFFWVHIFYISQLPEIMYVIHDSKWTHPNHFNIILA